MILALLPSQVRAQSKWRSREVLRVGPYFEKGLTFEQITDIATSNDGRIFLLDGRTNAVEVLAPDGEFIRAIGAGALEFIDPNSILITGDTLWVFDWRLQRAKAFDPDGKLLRTMPWNFNVATNGTPGKTYRLASGDYIVTSVTGCSAPPREGDNQWRLLQLSADLQSVQQAVMTPRKDHMVVYDRDNTQCAVLEMPFGRNRGFDLRSDGLLAIGDVETYEVDLFRVKPGVTPQDWIKDVVVLRHDVGATNASRADWHAYESRVLLQYVPPRTSAQTLMAIRDALEEDEYPKAWSVIDRLLFDREGRLWVRRTPHEMQRNATWDVFDQNSTYSGSLELPARLRVLKIEKGMLFGIEKDENGLAALEGYLVWSEH